MGQFGFFDADRRLAAITAKGDPLEMIARVVPFESFRVEIEAAVLTPVSEKKSNSGRKPIDRHCSRCPLMCCEGQESKPLRVGIAAAGRFHLLDLARELETLGVEVK